MQQVEFQQHQNHLWNKTPGNSAFAKTALSSYDGKLYFRVTFIFAFAFGESRLRKCAKRYVPYYDRKQTDKKQ